MNRSYSPVVALLATVVLAGSSRGHQALPAAKPEATRPLVIALVDAETGQPVTGATVTLRESAKYKTPRPVDDRGRVTIDVPADWSYVSVLCRKDGYATTSAYWQNKDDSPVDLPAQQTVKLPKGKSIGGRVLDEDGRPVSGAKVTISYFAPDEGNTPPAEQPVVRAVIPWETRETNADGRWSYAGAPPDANEFSVHVQHKDYARETDDFDVPPINSLFDGSAEKVLERGVEIAGTVTDNDGKPVAGARVSTVETTHVINDYGVTTKTDAAGKFRLAHVPNKKPATLTVSAAGHSPEMFELDVTKGPPPAQSIVLAPGRTIRGRVVDPDGNPVEGVTLLVRGWRNKASINPKTTSGKDGKFVLKDAPADEVRCHVFKEGFAYQIDVKLTAGTNEDDESVVKVIPEGKSSGL